MPYQYHVNVTFAFTLPVGVTPAQTVTIDMNHYPMFLAFHSGSGGKTLRVPVTGYNWSKATGVESLTPNVTASLVTSTITINLPAITSGVEQDFVAEFRINF